MPKAAGGQASAISSGQTLFSRAKRLTPAPPPSWFFQKRQETTVWLSGMSKHSPRGCRVSLGSWTSTDWTWEVCLTDSTSSHHEKWKVLNSRSIIFSSAVSYCVEAGWCIAPYKAPGLLGHSYALSSLCLRNLWLLQRNVDLTDPWKIL